MNSWFHWTGVLIQQYLHCAHMEFSKQFMSLLVLSCIACGGSEIISSVESKERFYPPSVLHLEDVCVLDSIKVTTCKSKLQEHNKSGLLRLSGIEVTISFSYF